MFDDPRGLAHRTQSTRMLKLVCTGCGWSCRTTRKHLERDGLICPRPVCGGDLEPAA